MDTKAILAQLKIIEDALIAGSTSPNDAETLHNLGLVFASIDFMRKELTETKQINERIAADEKEHAERKEAGEWPYGPEGPTETISDILGR